MEHTDAQPGRILAGKYKIERVLGAGGMGVVAAAMHLQLDERVAIKFLLPEALENEEIVARFNREARAAVKIKSEHVARVIDVGELESGAPYIVMEYLEGLDLQQVLDRHGPLAIDDVVEKVLQACEALAEAHSLGIVHRDLKPANLFVSHRADSTDCVKLLDFGVSKSSLLSDSDQKNLTQTASVLGSPYYMSPEQLSSSKDVNGQADIWSIGVILYELLTAKVPFDAESIAQLVLAIVQNPAPNLLDHRPEADPGLASVVARCLEKDRNARYANVAELARDLAPFGTDVARASLKRIEGVLAVAAGDSAAKASADNEPSVSFGKPLGKTQEAWGLTQSRPKSHGRKAAVIGLVAIVLGLLIFFFTRESPETETAAQALASSPTRTSSVPPGAQLPQDADPTRPPPGKAPISSGSSRADSARGLTDETAASTEGARAGAEPATPATTPKVSPLPPQPTRSKKRATRKPKAKSKKRPAPRAKAPKAQVPVTPKPAEPPPPPPVPEPIDLYGDRE